MIENIVICKITCFIVISDLSILGYSCRYVIQISASEPGTSNKQNGTSTVSKRDAVTTGPSPTHGTGTLYSNIPTKTSHIDGARRSFYSALDTFHVDFTNVDANDASDDDRGCQECCYNTLDDPICNKDLHRCIKGIKCFILNKCICCFLINGIRVESIFVLFVEYPSFVVYLSCVNYRSFADYLHN